MNTSTTSKVIEVRNMSTMEIIETIPAATVEDAEKALQAAKEGAKVWAATPTYKRVEIIERFVSALREKQDELGELLSAENGKIISQGKGEIGVAAQIFSEFAQGSKRLFGQTIPLDIQEGLESDLMITKREPLGVMVGILPFNFPAELFAQKAGAALAAGNAIVVKPPEDDPLTIMRMAEMLHEAGVPKNVLQIVAGYGEDVGAYLTSSPLVNAISFTGSTATGTSIYESGAKNLSRVFLELGANDALVVCEDGDVDQAVDHAIEGRLLANGQVCCANKRLVVHSSIAEEFTQKLVEKLSAKKIGNQLDETTDVGPLIHEEAAIRVEQQIKHAVQQGAELRLGGIRVNKTFIEPTVLVNVTDDMDIAKDMEVFGPVFPIVTFETFEEAIAIVNGTKYGLNSAIFTKDMNRAIEAGNRIEAGIVSINGGTCYRPVCSAFGGYKKSGIGREGTNYTLEELTQLKSIVLRGVMN